MDERNQQSFLSHRLQCTTICDGFYCDTYLHYKCPTQTKKHAVLLYIVMDEITKVFLIDYNVQKNM